MPGKRCWPLSVHPRRTSRDDGRLLAAPVGARVPMAVGVRRDGMAVAVAVGPLVHGAFVHEVDRVVASGRAAGIPGGAVDGDEELAAPAEGDAEGVAQPGDEDGVRRAEGVVRRDAAVRVVAQHLAPWVSEVLRVGRRRASGWRRDRVLVTDGDVELPVGAEVESAALVTAVRAGREW